MGSGRLPGKILMRVHGQPMLKGIVQRCRESRFADNVIVATTDLPKDDIVAEFCKKNEISFFRGDEEDVLKRYYETARQFGSEIIVRVTADCPLIDPGVVDMCVEKFNNHKGVDYLSNTLARTFPRGLDAEVFHFKALEKAHKNAFERYEREHVTPYIWENKRGEFIIGENLEAEGGYKRDYRLTVDYQEDFYLINAIYAALYNGRSIVNSEEAIRFLDSNPQIAAINANCEQKRIH